MSRCGGVAHWQLAALLAALLARAPTAPLHLPLCRFSLCELPTLLLSAGHVDPTWRSDAWFGCTFALTRIAWFAALALPLVLAGTNFAQRFAVCVIFPVHVYWLVQWARGYARRHSAARRQPAVEIEPHAE